MKQLEPQQLKELLTEWKIVDPLLFARRFNRLLRTTEVRREYHRCALAADAVKRWECLEYFNFDRYSPPRMPLTGEQFLLPYQVVTMDWDWNLGSGRRPLYHQFVMPSLCHWRASADLMIARKLMPEYEWVVASGANHTAVMAPEQQLIWDPTYFAMGVSAQASLEGVFGTDFSQDYDLHAEEYSFSRFTIELIHVFSLLDSAPEEQRLKLVQGFPQVMKGNDLDMATTTSLSGCA